ncbi:MAG TPA: MFS transporter [Rhodopila sp.]|uniref:MFS transporter n=1 Tax=Rhodopila sp. TaxID=2480087 RepID=UPI002CBB414C|nr:MFS transporter [Rhodopila sp.]HVY16632.1 MFS transporter [Rhodopila sp.]
MPSHRWAARLPVYYGWVIVGVAFVTMAFGVTARTSFSLLLPPLLNEFGWDRADAAGAFSAGFLLSAAVSPLVGRVMDRHGPRIIIECGVGLITIGLLCAPMITALWQLYVTLGVLVGLGSNLMSFSVQSLYLPNWFVRRRGLAISIAFSGVGVGAIILLPWLQTIIIRSGWRTSCWVLGVMVLGVLGPLNLLLRRRPADLDLLPDGMRQDGTSDRHQAVSNIADPAWAAIDWRLRNAIRTARFWWISLAYFCALFSWYAVQVHQTKYLMEIGFPPIEAAWALGLVSVVAIPGQIAFGALSDRIGREWVWAAGCLGFVLTYVLLIALSRVPAPSLLYAMVLAQGFLGYALTSVMGAIVVEIYEGPHFGSIFGAINVASVCGGAAGPWMTGVIHDATGGYGPAFLLAMGCSVVSAVAVWIAAPRKVRLVPGRAYAAARRA